jgi:vitamin B12 transporter
MRNPIRTAASMRLALLALGGLSATAFAAGEPRQRVHRFDEQRVSAAALPTTAASASQHITVLTRTDLDAFRGDSVARILQRQAGIVIDRSARSGGFGSLFLRGADPSHVVVLIDHVRQNDPLSSRGSAVDLNTLSSDDVERIEVVRGNASVVNAEAMAGLIHIFTRRAAPGAAAGISYGGDGLQSARAAWAGSGLRIGAASREDGAGVDGSGRVRAANAAWEQAFGERARLAAILRVSDGHSRGFPDDSGGAGFAELRTLESRRADSAQFALRTDVDVGETGASLQIHAARIVRGGAESSPGVAPGTRDPFGLPAIDSSSDYRRDELQALWLLPLHADLLLTLGAAHQREHGTLDSLIRFGAFDVPARFGLDRDTTSAFSELRWQRDDFTLQAGLRTEHGDGSGTRTHPLLSFQRAAGGSGAHWGASVARSSRPPSFYALGHPLVGNPLLAPERATHRELSYATAADSNWPTRWTLFSARYHDLVDIDSGPPPQLVNRARIDADGIEWRTRHGFADDWRLLLEGTWMRVRDPGGEVTLRQRPRLQAGAQLWIPFERQRELGLMLRHVGRRFDSSIPTGDRWLDAATTLDVSMRQALGPLQLALTLENAFDDRAQETIGTAIPGRRLFVSLDWPLGPQR